MTELLTAVCSWLAVRLGSRLLDDCSRSTYEQNARQETVKKKVVCESF